MSNDTYPAPLVISLRGTTVPTLLMLLPSPYRYTARTILALASPDSVTLLAFKLPPESMLPIEDIVPAVTLPVTTALPDIVAVPVIAAFPDTFKLLAVLIFPAALMFPVAFNLPANVALLPLIFPVAFKFAATFKFEPVNTRFVLPAKLP